MEKTINVLRLYRSKHKEEFEEEQHVVRRIKQRKILIHKNIKFYKPEYKNEIPE